MSQQRRVLYINLNEGVRTKLDAIAAFIIAMAPSHPLFPQPLRPSRMADIEAGQYNLLELVECCARLLALHITQGLVSDEELRLLAQEVDILRDAPIQAIGGNVLQSLTVDLHAIHAQLMRIGTMAFAVNRGSVNLKTPLMVAILYAYEVVRQ